MLLRLSYLFLVISLAAGAFFWVYFARLDDASPMYVGSARCGVCHTQSSIGAQFRVWQTGPHSKAHSLLEHDTVKQYLRKHQLSADSCMSCHSTLGRSSHNRFEAAVNAEGVGCERCHGPGSQYSRYDIMIDRPAFLANGGGVGSTSDCTQCHAEHLDSSTRHCPFQLEDFQRDSAWKLIQHSLPPRPEKPDTVLKLRES